MNVDYETEVEDDILPIFRKGEVRSYILELLWITNEICLGPCLFGHYIIFEHPMSKCYPFELEMPIDILNWNYNHSFCLLICKIILIVIA